MTTHIEVTAAFGRSYPTLRLMLEDWDDGKDFKITTGPYVSKREADEMNLWVVGRYGKDLGKVGYLRRAHR